jgi:hypothetical protein
MGARLSLDEEIDDGAGMALGVQAKERTSKMVVNLVSEENIFDL